MAVDLSALSDGSTGWGPPTRAALTYLDTNKLDVSAAASTYAPKSLTGAYASRPVASAVSAGTLYFATDVPEAYRSDGTAWSVVGSGGSELGYAQITTQFSTVSATYVDVTALTTTFVVGERPISIRMNGQVANSSTTTITYVGIILDGTEIGRAQSLGIGSAIWHDFYASARASGLTPGSTHTAKIQAKTQTATTTTAYVGGENATAPASIHVVTL